MELTPKMKMRNQAVLERTWILALSHPDGPAHDRIEQIRGEAQAADAESERENDIWYYGVQYDLDLIANNKWKPLPPLQPLKGLPDA